jgi:hypothetical protein
MKESKDKQLEIKFENGSAEINVYRFEDSNLKCSSNENIIQIVETKILQLNSRREIYKRILER